MIALIPIFLQRNDPLWSLEKNRALLCKPVVAAMHCSKISRVVVYSNDVTLLEAVKDIGAEAHLLDMAADGTPAGCQFFPAGSSAALRHLDKTILPVVHEVIVILSFRNPFLSSAFIEEAINRYESSESRILLSACKPTDHPCQLDAYYKILDIGFIHMFEEEETVSDFWTGRENPFANTEGNGGKGCGNIDKPAGCRVSHKITRPFSFDWQSKNVAHATWGEIFIRDCVKQQVFYKPLEAAPQSAIDAGPSVMWVYEGPQSARLVLRSDILTSRPQKTTVLTDHRMIGAALADNHQKITMALYQKSASDDFCFLFMEPPAASACELKACAVHSPPQQGTEELTVRLVEQGHAVCLEYKEKNISGILYSLLQFAGDDTYDLSEPFPAPNELWLNTGTHQRINANTGKTVMGRQDFPDVFQIEGSLFIIPGDDIATIPAEISNGKADFILMPANHAGQIGSPLDLLRYQAELRATTPC